MRRPKCPYCGAIGTSDQYTEFDNETHYCRNCGAVEMGLNEDVLEATDEELSKGWWRGPM